MASLNILCLDLHNFLKEITRKKKKEKGKKHIRKFSVIHDKFSKIFHGPSIFA